MNKALVTSFFLLTTAYNCGQQTIEQRNIASVPSHNLSLSCNGTTLATNESFAAQPIVTHTLCKTPGSDTVLIQERTATPVKSWYNCETVTCQCQGQNSNTLHSHSATGIIHHNLVLYKNTVKELNLTATEAFDFAVTHQQADIIKDALSKLAQQGKSFDITKVLPFIFNSDITTQTMRETFDTLAKHGTTLDITNALIIINQRLNQPLKKLSPYITAAAGAATLASLYALLSERTRQSKNCKRAAIIGVCIGSVATAVGLCIYLQKLSETRLMDILLTSPACKRSA